LALEVAGMYAYPFQPELAAPGGAVNLARRHDTRPIGSPLNAPIAARYLNERAGSIYAGSNEIQRNIIAKSALSL